MAKILITGGTGLIGRKLVQILKSRKHQVSILTRTPKDSNHYKWDIENNYIDEDALYNTDFIIHLAGAGIGDKRWSSKRKTEIMQSRVASSRLLFSKIKELNIPIEKIISASAIGYYGAVTSENKFKENSIPNKDFIANVCVEWEKEVTKFQTLGIPQVILRIGFVLANSGSSLQKMDTPLFLACLGTGKQYLPFIHIDDLCSIFVNALDNSFNGVYNAVSPEQITLEYFINVLAEKTNKPILPINIPSLILKMGLGEMSNLVLNGSRICTEKISKIYKFKYPTLNECLGEIYKK